MIVGIGDRVGVVAGEGVTDVGTGVSVREGIGVIPQGIEISFTGGGFEDDPLKREEKKFLIVCHKEEDTVSEGVHVGVGVGGHQPLGGS